MIKNIVFDMGGVLIHFKPAALLAHFDISPADRDESAVGNTGWPGLAFLECSGPSVLGLHI